MNSPGFVPHFSLTVQGTRRNLWRKPRVPQNAGWSTICFSNRIKMLFLGMPCTEETSNIFDCVLLIIISNIFVGSALYLYIIWWKTWTVLNSTPLVLSDSMVPALCSKIPPADNITIGHSKDIRDQWTKPLNKCSGGPNIQHFSRWTAIGRVDDLTFWFCRGLFSCILFSVTGLFSEFWFPLLCSIFRPMKLKAHVAVWSVYTIHHVLNISKKVFSHVTKIPQAMEQCD